MTAATKKAPASATLALTLPAGELIAAFKDALLFTANDMARPILDAVHIVVTAETLKVYATDSYTLIERTVELGEEQARWPFDVLVSRRWIDLMVKVMALDKGAPVTLRVADGVVILLAGSTTFTVPQTTGEYPNVLSLLDGKIDASNDDFALNPQFLARVGKLSKAQDSIPVRVRGRGKIKPVAFECPDTRVLLMPVRVS